jgi:predicted nucleotidyltransferase
VQRESAGSVRIRHPVPRETALKIARRFGRVLAAGGEVREAWLFGSYARGEQRFGSDLDICVVLYGTPSKDIFFKLLSEFYDISTKIEVQLHLYSAADFDKMLSNNSRFVRGIVESGMPLVQSGILAKSLDSSSES